MMLDALSPAIILLLGALLIGLTRGSLRSVIVLAAPALTLYAIWQIADGVAVTWSYLGFQIEPVEGSPVRRLFATVFALMTLVGGLYAFRQATGRELAAAFAYAASAIGVAFAGDLITLFVYWEIMAIASTAVVWSGNTEGARKAGYRYALMHLLGGVLLMAGICAHAVQSGSIDIANLRVSNMATALIFAGVLINVAAPPVSAWLADAYPESSATGAVFLSAYTTKTAVLVLILLFPGEKILIPVGLYMIFYGIIYALLENDARRILAYSIVNQVGFMVCAIGIGTELALNGAAAHAFAHIIYKALLFMSAGAVLYRTGVRKCSDLGGLFRTMPITCLCGIIGALAISSFPLTSGFTTKTLISEAAAKEGLVAVYFCLAAASAGVFLHAGIKFPWFVFFQKDSGLRPKDAPWNMIAAMVVMAFLCIALGVFPQPLYAMLPFPVEMNVYQPGKVLFYLQLLLFSGLAFFLLLPLMKRTETITLDFDWIWRRALATLWKQASRVWASVSTGIGGGLAQARARTLKWISVHWGVEGVLSRSWPIGVTAFWIVLLLTLYVVVYFV